jgi:hypothetical protein
MLGLGGKGVGREGEAGRFLQNEQNHKYSHPP